MMYKKGFTLIELTVWIVLIGIWLTSIINVLQYATRLTNTAKSEVVAINLAREWVETVFNIRDTNWKMFSSKKDQCRLSRQPDYTNITCENLPRLHNQVWWQYYYLKSPFKNISYFTWENILVPTTGALTVMENKWDDTGISSNYRMCFFPSTGSDSGYWDTCSWSSNGEFDTKYGRYRRSIEIKGIYSKWWIPWGTPMTCTRWSDAWCWTSSAKELRFCSRVDYYFGIARRVELCSAITNFEE